MSVPKAPITLRLDDVHRDTLEKLTQDDSASDVLRRGLRMVAGAEASTVPLYPRLIEEQEIDDAAEEATDAAVEVLDQLFPAKGKELRGIGSNFQGTLKEHILAMLTGKEAATWSHHRHINALFGDWRSLGRIRSADAHEGYGVVQLPERRGDELLYFHSDSRRFVPLAKVGADTLFTSKEAALKAAFAWMKDEELSPRDLQLKLCVLSYADEGPLRMTAVAN